MALRLNEQPLQSSLYPSQGRLGKKWRLSKYCKPEESRGDNMNISVWLLVLVLSPYLSHMRCPGCGAHVAVSHRFCGYCRVTISEYVAWQRSTKLCTKCGKTIPFITEFCPQCGAKQGTNFGLINFYRLPADFCVEHWARSPRSSYHGQRLCPLMIAHSLDNSGGI